MHRSGCFWCQMTHLGEIFHIKEGILRNKKIDSPYYPRPCKAKSRTQTNYPCTALVSWQLPLGLCGGYGERYIWIPCEKLDSFSLKNSMCKVDRTHQKSTPCGPQYCTDKARFHEVFLCYHCVCYIPLHSPFFPPHITYSTQPTNPIHQQHKEHSTVYAIVCFRVYRVLCALW